MERLRNDAPSAVQFDQSMKVGVVKPSSIFLHIDLNNSRRRRNPQYVKSHLDVRCFAVMIDVVVQVAHRAAEKCLVCCETVHGCVFMEGLAEESVVGGYEAVYVGLDDFYYGVVF